MTGVVLCGGQSMRMGSDKGLMQQESITWTELAVNKLSTLHIPVVISVSEQQYPSYCNAFPKLTIIKDSASLIIYGPLKGILSTHLEFPHEDLVVLACDMPSMNPVVLQHLLDFEKSSRDEAVVFRNERYVEPLCAVYKNIGLSNIVQMYNQGQLEKYGLYTILENLKTLYLDIPEEWQPYFKNYNSPSDLNPS